jgi:hypothetical protein
MNIDLTNMKIEMSLEKMIEIINGREKAALMKTIMSNGKENPLCVEYNEGVKMMAKYMRDWFGNVFDDALYKANRDGGVQ